MDAKTMQQTSNVARSSPDSKTTESKFKAGSEKFEGSRDKSPVNEEVLERFQELLGQKDKENLATEEHDYQHSSPAFLSSPNSGSSRVVAATNGTSTDELVELVTKLVDKMWVRQADSSQVQEVRLDLKNNHLPDTELKISKVDGQLMVQFATPAAASYQHLMANRAQLIQLLQRRYGQDGVTLKVDLLNDDQEQSADIEAVQSVSANQTLLGF